MKNFRVNLKLRDGESPPRSWNSKDRQDRSKRNLQDITCFNYQQKGHYSSDCPRNVLFCSERRVHKGVSVMKEENPDSQSQALLRDVMLVIFCLIQVVPGVSWDVI